MERAQNELIVNRGVFPDFNHSCRFKLLDFFIFSLPLISKLVTFSVEFNDGGVNPEILHVEDAEPGGLEDPQVSLPPSQRLPHLAVLGQQQEAAANTAASSS